MRGVELLATLVALLLAAPALSEQEDPTPLRPGIVETDRVEVVEAWPFVVKPRKNADVETCRQLGPSDIRVLEDGQAVRVIDVSRAPPLATHVLMIDSSSSMMSGYYVASRRKSRQARAAAKAYVGWMLQDAESTGATSSTERLMLATFDDDLILRLEPTSIDDRETAERVNGIIDAINGGFRTALNDSLYWLIDELAGRRTRANVILISDGVDQGSMTPYDRVAELAEETHNVTLFSIGIGLGQDSFEKFLQSISAATGGKYYWVRSRNAQNLVGPLEKKFEEIRRRLQGQLYVSYVAEPAVDAQPGERRSVRIQSLNDRCKIPDDGYRRNRTVRRSATPAPDDEAAEAPLRPTIAGTIGERQLKLHLVDRVLDPDPLIRFEGDPVMEKWSERDVIVEVSELDAALAGAVGVPHNPTELVRTWLEREILPSRAEAGKMPVIREDWFPLDRVMGGATFLGVREPLAEVVYTQFPDYRDWARRKVEARIRADFERQLPPPEDADELERYRRQLTAIVDERMTRIEPADYKDDLAAWLGDVSTRQLALTLERDLANAALESHDAEGSSASRRWLSFHDWLSFPHTTRVVTPLQLMYDAKRDVWGYYRVLRPRLGDLPEDLSRTRGKTLLPANYEQYVVYERAKVPKHPFGLMTIEWLCGTTAGERLRSDWRVTSFEHFPEVKPVPSEASASVARHCERRIRISLTSTSGGEDATVDVRLEGHYDSTPAFAGPPEFPDPCEERSDPPRLVPLCFTTEDARLTETLNPVLEPCPD